MPPKKAAAKRPAVKAAAKKAAAKRPARKTTAKRPPPPPAAPKPEPEYGPVETAVRAELHRLKVTESGLAQSAFALAYQVDNSTGASAVSIAARELRMTMTSIRGLTVSAGDDKPAGDGDAPTGDASGEGGSVTRLESVRRKAAAGRGRRK